MKVSAHYESGRKTVAILTTGGTIAGSGEIGKETGYVPGALSAEELIASVPQLSESVNIRAVEICSVNSDDITGEIWIHMARTINELAQDDEIAGFVVTHGTDTLEESAYFLDLTVKTDKPVVLTGAMRPATSLSADGAMSLYQAVCAAADKKSVGLGVLCVFSDQIFSARAVGKSSTYQVTAISGGETGCLGVVRNDEVFYYQAPLRRHTTASEFDVSAISRLPKVEILYFYVDADPAMVEFAAARSDGLVIAGAGAGEFSKRFIDAIEGLSIPVIISSRTGGGVITRDSLLCKNTVSAGDLSPQKAAILLRLALTQGCSDRKQLKRMFSEY